jgi:DNA mismatch repair ATPase MutL
VKNDSDKITKKVKKINKIKDQLAQLRAKLKASEDQQTSFSSKPKFKKIKAKTQQSKNENLEARVEKKKAKVQKKKKAKEEKKKQARIAAEAKKKAEEEAKKKEEDLKRTYEEELEEQLTEEEITGFQLEKIDMDRMCNKVCEIIAGYETQGTLQSELWKKLKLSSRDGSRLALKLERMGMITREKILEKERWTYKLIIKKIPISTKSIEGGPCLTCPVVTRCSLDGEISPRTCQWIEDWVMIELKNK